VFDANIEIYSAKKIMRVNYDTPYMKGLPTTLIVREKVGEAGYQERTLRTTYEDTYIRELIESYNCVVGKKTPKISIEDAQKGLDIFKMIMQAGGW